MSDNGAHALRAAFVTFLLDGGEVADWVNALAQGRIGIEHHGADDYRVTDSGGVVFARVQSRAAARIFARVLEREGPGINWAKTSIDLNPCPHCGREHPRSQTVVVPGVARFESVFCPEDDGGCGAATEPVRNDRSCANYRWSIGMVTRARHDVGRAGAAEQRAKAGDGPRHCVQREGRDEEPAC